MALEKDIQELTQAVKALTEALTNTSTARKTETKPKPEAKPEPENETEAKPEPKPETSGEPSIAVLYEQNPAKAFDVLKADFLALCELDDQQAVDLLAQFKDKNGDPVKRLSAVLPDDYEQFLNNLRALLKGD